jgi:hypothetical protein
MNTFEVSKFENSKCDTSKSGAILAAMVVTQGSQNI